MTRPSKNSLVLDGSEVKYRLEAERIASKSVVHVDWVRFTVIRRNSPLVKAQHLFPLPFISERQEPQYLAWVDQVKMQFDERYEANRLAKLLASVPDCDFDASTQALELAQAACEALGPDFTVPADVRKGHDFYKFRWSIERNGIECGWVGYLSSGESPRQQAQALTIHCNIFGSACTFASPGWTDRMADLIDSRDATIK